MRGIPPAFRPAVRGPARGVALVLLALLAAATSPPARGADVEAKAPDPRAGLEVHEWKGPGGIVCWWRAPRAYDPEKGVNLTFILHGSNLTHQWGFANHQARSFRTDDFVVCPDGTTPNGQGGFNFLAGDARKFRALVEELGRLLKVRAVFLYGHSQGSFFALQYAGEFPEEVDGVVAHASGLWTSTPTGKKGHAQAIVLLHGTEDPVVPYGQSVGAYDALREAGYPLVRLRSLEGWNHWPAELNGPVPHTSQQLAWVEGMTTEDPERIAACFEVLADVNSDGASTHDVAGLWSLARRIEGLEALPGDLRARAAKAKGAVEDLARAHVAALGAPEKLAFDGKPWVGHLPVFLRAFAGVPAADEVAERLGPQLAEQRKDATARLRKYWAAVGKQASADAFAEGLAALEAGFLCVECWDGTLLENLKTWHKDARKLKLAKPAIKRYDAFVDDFGKARTAGWKAFESVQRTLRVP